MTEEEPESKDVLSQVLEEMAQSQDAGLRKFAKDKLKELEDESDS